MVGWHHSLNGHEFEPTLGVGEGQGSLVCCSPQGRKESDMTERLNSHVGVGTQETALNSSERQRRAGLVTRFPGSSPDPLGKHWRHLFNILNKRECSFPTVSGRVHLTQRRRGGREGLWVAGREEVSLGMMEQPSFLHWQQSHMLQNSIMTLSSLAQTTLPHSSDLCTFNLLAGWEGVG